MLFLKSEFGTGSNYQLINGVSSFASLSFSNTDVAQTMTTGVQWDLVDPAAVTANHVCMAVEISGPEDPSGNPTLLGRAPGWSNGTDLLVISDNNKAQRNLNVYTGTDDGESMTMYALVHNAALFTRDMWIVMTPEQRNPKQKIGRLVRAGEAQGESYLRGDTLILANMKPCENRWMEFTVTGPPLSGENGSAFIFEELVGVMKVNGFVLEVKTGALEEMGWENLGEHAFAFERLLKDQGTAAAAEQVKVALELLSTAPSIPGYESFLEKYGQSAVDIVGAWLPQSGPDLFGLQPAGNSLGSLINAKNWKKAAAAHGNFCRKLSAYLSYLSKQRGDPADILQVIRWQDDLLNRSDVFQGADLAEESSILAGKFIADYDAVELTNKDYPDYVSNNLPLWEKLMAEKLPQENFKIYFQNMRDHLNDIQQLQKHHCAYVSRLAEVLKL